MGVLKTSHAGNDTHIIKPVGRLLSVKDVTKETSLSRTTIFRRVRDGQFPKSISLGGNRVARSAAAVKEWKQACARVAV